MLRLGRRRFSQRLRVGLTDLEGGIMPPSSFHPLPAALELAMKKAVVCALAGIILLFGVGLVAGLHVFAPWDRILADKPGDPLLAPGEMSWNTYKKTKLALGSFDLVNGLTKHDLETMHTDNSLGFYYLLACLWLVVALRFGFQRPRRK